MLFRRYRLKRRVKRRVKRIVEEFSEFLNGRNYNVYVQWLGDLNINEDFCFWLKTETDQERDRVSTSKEINDEFNHLVEKFRIVESGSPNSIYGVESQQTVTRDYQGDWRQATH